MSVTAFDHVNIRTVNLAALTAWYETVLGLRHGPRPDFPVPGAWLYLGEACVLHLMEADPAPQQHDADESLRLEHVAFRGTDRAGFLAHLDRHGVAFTQFPFEAIGAVLVFLRDPDGNRLHVDFPADEA